MNRRTRQRLDDLEAELAHKDRLHKALLKGYDAIEESQTGAKIAAELLVDENNRLEAQARAVRQYAENLTASGNSAYRKAGNRLLELLTRGNNHPEDITMTG